MLLAEDTNTEWHRMAKVGKGSGGFVVLRHGHPDYFSQDMSWLSNISEEGNSTAFPVNLCLVLDHPHSESVS